MPHQVCRHVRRTLSVSTLLLLPAAGFSQEASEVGAASSQELTETVVVTGIRASFDNAIKAKRNADAIVDAISAEDVGKFPDQNVAESLSHLPGLSVDRQFGEGEKVSILGTDPALNRVLINGQTVASADWGGNPNDPTSRTFNYLLLSPDLIGLAEVYKSQESRLDEGSIGGTVIIHTRKPLDLAPDTVRVSGGYEYNDRSESGNMRGSLLYSWKDADANFGILGAYSHDKENLARAGLEVFGYSDASSLATSSPNAKITGNLAGALYPAGINADYFQQTRQRDSFTTTLQANPTDSLKFDLTGIYIQGKYDNLSQAMFIYPAASPSDLLSATVNNGLVTSASYGPGAYSERDADFRKTTVKTDSITLTTNWDSGGPISLQNVIGSTKASGGKDPEYLVALYGSSPYSYSYTGTSATVNFAQSPSDPTTFGRAQGQQIGGIGYYVQGDTEKYAQLDLTWKIDAGPLSKLLAGVKYTDHENYEVVDTSKVFVQNAYTSEAAFDPGTTPSNLFNGVGINGNIAQFDVVSATQADFSLTPCTTNVTVVRGGTAPGVTFTFTPFNGFQGSIAVSSVVDSAVSASYTFSVNPVIINSTAAGTTSFVLTASQSDSKTATGMLKVASASPHTRSKPWYVAGSGASLACLILVALPRRRRRFGALLVVLLSVAALSVSGCGGSSSSSSSGSSGSGGTTPVVTNAIPGTYNITVTGVATTATGNIVHSTTVTFTVQ